MLKFGWSIVLPLLAVLPIFCEASGNTPVQILTVNMGINRRVDITIPCGDREPPYTYTHSGSPVVGDVNEYYTAVDQDQSNNGDRYCCSAMGGVTCYQFNITYPPYIDYGKFQGIPSAAILGEPYDIECPYESNPPAHYDWSRVPSCGSIQEPMSWPTNTILMNNNKTLRLDGVLPLHYGYYNCSATNAFGSGWFCMWRKVDVCSQEEYSAPDVEIQNHHPNITVVLYDNVTINCTIRSIGRRGSIVWRFNDTNVNSSDNVGVITNNYDNELCGIQSRITINNFTRANDGLYTCYASQPTSNSSSDSVYVLTETLTSTDITASLNQPEGSFIIPLTTSLSGVAVFLVITIAVSVAILIKSRKNILSQQVNTQHFTKPPSDYLQFKYDFLPIYAEDDRKFVDKNFLTPLDKNGYSILDHHLNFIPGNPISDNMLIAIKESRYIVPFITENFLKSKYCVYELEQSVLRMIKTKSTCIIPVASDIKLLPECLKSLLTSVILEDHYIGYTVHVDRIKTNVGSPMCSK